MKKLFIVLALFLTFNVLAQDTINQSTKPTDDEIRQAIDKFNFDKKQKEHLFKEMKKQIDEMYDKPCPIPDYVEPSPGMVDSLRRRDIPMPN